MAALARRSALGALCLSALMVTLVLYLAFNGGGYAIAVHGRVGIVGWWIVLVGVLFGLLPVARLGRGGTLALALLGGFVVWTGVAASWSLSRERSLQSLALDAGYLGIFALGLLLHRDRQLAVRRVVGALAAAITIVGGAAILARLDPRLFPAVNDTASALHLSRSRLAWPLGYWNALAELMAFGLPLLLGCATSARRSGVRAIAAAAIPVVTLCAFLTYSRDGEITATIAVAAFLALASDRLSKFVTAAIAAAGGAVLIGAAVHRGDVEHGFAGAFGHQSLTMAIWIVGVCATVAVAQVAIDRLRRRRPRRAPRISAAGARRVAGVVAAAGLGAIVVLAASGIAADGWHRFEDSRNPQLAADSPSRFALASGNGRYDYWRVAWHAFERHVLTGSGPGTFQLLWLPRAPYESYVVNAHSLYLETLSDVGLVGFALLGGFLVLTLAAAVRWCSRAGAAERTWAAGAAAALSAFVVAAAADWTWQNPVLPIAFLLVAGAVLSPAHAPDARDADDARAAADAASPRRLPAPARRAARGLAALAAMGGIAAVGVPMATARDVGRSQVAASRGDYASAIADARAATGLEPGAATPWLQLALVREAQGRDGIGLQDALQAASDDRADWSTWLVVSRLEAETGNAPAAVHAYRRARSLNPRSSLFTS